MDATPVLICPPAEWDAVNGTCSSPEWIVLPSPFIPSLAASDGLVISGAIIGLWAIGFTIRMVRRTVSSR